MVMNTLLVQGQKEWNGEWMNEPVGRQVNCAPAQYGSALQARDGQINVDGVVSVFHLGMLQFCVKRA